MSNFFAWIVLHVHAMRNDDGPICLQSLSMILIFDDGVDSRVAS